MIAMIQHTAYQGQEDLVAMQTALAYWIQEVGDCAYGHVGDLPHRMYNGLRGRFRVEEMVRIWRDNTDIAAFALCYPNHEGYDAFVAPAYRDSDVERAALEWAYATTRLNMNQNGKQGENLLTDVAECDTARIRVLEKLGYLRDDASWLVLNEAHFHDQVETFKLPHGFSIRGATGPDDAEQLAAVHSGAFNSNWTADVYRDEVMLKPGYHPELERVVVAPDGRFAAFCVLWLDEINHVGLFEPVGTHSDFQRMGLGKALMADSLRMLWQLGFSRAQVASEVSNDAANALYRSVGFQPKHKFISYWRKPETR